MEGWRADLPGLDGTVACSSSSSGRAEWCLRQVTRVSFAVQFDDGRWAMGDEGDVRATVLRDTCGGSIRNVLVREESRE